MQEVSKEELEGMKELESILKKYAGGPKDQKFVAIIDNERKLIRITDSNSVFNYMVITLFELFKIPYSIDKNKKEITTKSSDLSEAGVLVIKKEDEELCDQNIRS